MPSCIGLITGKDSDAEKDVLKNAKLRWPNVEFKVVNTLVQGDKAAPEIISAMKQLDQDPEVDVIIVARGGGSFLDLVVFSDEELVRTAAKIQTPLVSAIGHENDRPVLDDVADLRASTPTDAAKRVVPDVTEQRAMLSQLTHRAFLRIATAVQNQSELISQLRSRPLMANPYGFIEKLDEETEREIIRLRNRFSQLLDVSALELSHLKAQVRSLSPQSTLDRGYAVLLDSGGHVVTNPTKITKGSKLTAKLAKGELPLTAD